MRTAVLLSIREFLLEKLSYPCHEGSDYKDTSYNNFSKMIRLDGTLIHIDVLYLYLNLTDRLTSEPIVAIWIGNGNMSYKFKSINVDISAPDFGDLLEVVERYLAEAIVKSQKPTPLMDD